jgi:glutamate synthase (NADPH) large chain
MPIGGSPKHQRRRPHPLHAPRPAEVQGRRRRRTGRFRSRSRTGQRDRQAVLHRRDELRLDLAEAHETLAIAMNRLGGKSNTGEGGEDPSVSSRCPTATPSVRRSSRSPRDASASRSVPDQRRRAADQDLAGRQAGRRGRAAGPQGRRDIARIRYSTPGVGLISPPPHHDIYSIEDLAQLIHDLKNANPRRASASSWSPKSAWGHDRRGRGQGARRSHPDLRRYGGTGASPLTSIKHAGLPWELGIAETHQTLVLNDLRSRVVLQTDGG